MPGVKPDTTSDPIATECNGNCDALHKSCDTGIVPCKAIGRIGPDVVDRDGHAT
jgi:hypothetical protein